MGNHQGSVVEEGQVWVPRRTISGDQPALRVAKHARGMVYAYSNRFAPPRLEAVPVEDWIANYELQQDRDEDSAALSAWSAWMIKEALAEANARDPGSPRPFGPVASPHAQDIRVFPKATLRFPRTPSRPQRSTEPAPVRRCPKETSASSDPKRVFETEADVLRFIEQHRHRYALEHYNCPYYDHWHTRSRAGASDRTRLSVHRT